MPEYIIESGPNAWDLFTKALKRRTNPETVDAVYLLPSGRRQVLTTLKYEYEHEVPADYTIAGLDTRHQERREQADAQDGAPA